MGSCSAREPHNVYFDTQFINIVGKVLKLNLIVDFFAEIGIIFKITSRAYTDLVDQKWTFDMNFSKIEYSKWFGR